LAFFLYVGMFAAGPPIMEWWNNTFDTPEGHVTVLFIILSNMVVISGSFNLVVWALSKLKIPFFEQYRINPDVLPHQYRNPGPGSKPIPSKRQKQCEFLDTT